MKRTSKYCIRNWVEYNKSLIQRGSLTIWFSEDAIKTWLEEPSSKTKRDHPKIYSDEAILSALIKCHEALLQFEIAPLIPPQRNAVSKNVDNNPWRRYRNDAITEIRGLVVMTRLEAFGKD